MRLPQLPSRRVASLPSPEMKGSDPAQQYSSQYGAVTEGAEGCGSAVPLNGQYVHSKKDKPATQAAMKTPAPSSLTGVKAGPG